LPIYEYLCDVCGHQFDLLKSKMTTRSREKCPQCGGTAHQRLSTFGIASGSSDQMPCGADTCPAGTETCPGSTCPMAQS